MPLFKKFVSFVDQLHSFLVTAKIGVIFLGEAAVSLLYFRL